MRNSLGNMKSGLVNALTQKFEEIISGLNGSLNSASAAASSLWDGGFVGINEGGLDNLVTAIKKYCDEIEQNVESYAAGAAADTAFKGKVAGAVTEYIEAVKLCIKTYVSSLRIEANRATTAFESWKEQTTSVAETRSSAANELRNSASNFKLD